MPERTRSLINQILFYTALVVLFLLPDILFFAFHRHLPLCFFHEKIFILVLLAVLISFIKSNKIICVLLGVFALMQATQYCCLAYFGSPLNPFTISLVFEEAEDVFVETAHVALEYWYIPLLSFIPYGLCALLITKYKDRFSFSYSWVLTALFFIGFAVQSHVKSDLLMRSYCTAGFNTITAYTAYVGNILPRKLFDTDDAPEFKPYQTVKTEKTPDRNVIVVIGESLNRNHFSLYGYKRKTTPNMERRLHEGNNSFTAKEALSGAVNTLIAVPNFLHLQREPHNYKKQFVADTYLPKLAKQNGFKTLYVGMQGKAVYTKEALSFFDDTIIYKLSSADCLEDECMEKALQQVAFETPMFVVFQKRNPHAPYEENYPSEYAVFSSENPTVETNRIDTYDNALLYEDAVMDKLLTFIEQHTKRPTYVYYVSDHGEAMGEEPGVFGHSFVKASVLEIPFIFTSFHENDAVYTQKIKELYMPTAYEIGLLIAEKLGWQITNPNQEDGVYYANGHNKMGKAGYIRIEKNSAQKTLKRIIFEGTETE